MVFSTNHNVRYRFIPALDRWVRFKTLNVQRNDRTPMVLCERTTISVLHD